MLCITSPDLTHLITRSLYYLTTFIHFPHPALATINLFSILICLIYPFTSSVASYSKCISYQTYIWILFFSSVYLYLLVYLIHLHLIWLQIYLGWSLPFTIVGFFFFWWGRSYLFYIFFSHLLVYSGLSSILLFHFPLYEPSQLHDKFFYHSCNGNHRNYKCATVLLIPNINLWFH